MATQIKKDWLLFLMADKIVNEPAIWVNAVPFQNHLT